MAAREGAPIHKEFDFMTLSAVETDALKKAPAVNGVLHAFHSRWSPRSFAAREIGPEALRKVFEAARWAASSANGQPWRFVVGRNGDETWKKSTNPSRALTATGRTVPRS